MKLNPVKSILVAIIAVALWAFFHFDLGQYLTFEYLKAQQSELNTFYSDHQAPFILGFFAIYVLVTALSLPGAAVMTIAGGAIFGLATGVVIISFASTIGATLAFLVSRFILRESIEKKFGEKLKNINSGIEREGAFYLFTMRLIPAFPFFVINLVMGLTSMKAFTFYWVSQIGMLAGTIVYVNAGTQIAQLDSLKDIFSFNILLSFALLGVFPLIAKKAITFFKARQALKGYKRPKKFDYNVIAIGAGSAGLVTSYIAAAVKAKVALIEKNKMGGDCLNYGCVPSKALIKSAKVIQSMRRHEEFGIKKADFEIDFAQVMERVQRVIGKVEPHDSVERYTELGVECIQGEAFIKSPYEVEVDGKTLTTKNIVVATGAAPFVPPIKGLDKIDYLTSDTVWDLREKPEKLIVLGGGPIGTELTQAFCRLGVKVTQIEKGQRILGKEDSDVSEAITAKLKKEGVEILTSHEAIEFVVEGDKKFLICKHSGQNGEEERKIEFDRVLLAVGRAARLKGYGLDELGVRLHNGRTIEVNEFLQTNFPNIYACGDIVGPYQFTHTAAHQAWYAAVNALFGRFKKFKVDYRVIPWCTYSDPEVARVGLNEAEAKEQGIEYQVTHYGIDDLDRAICEEEDHGFVKVITPKDSDKILGVTIVGHHAGDIVAEYVAAMKHGFGMNKILGTIHIYPTLAEANKYAAGEWKRANQPEKLLRWVKRFHAWERG